MKLYGRYKGVLRINIVIRKYEFVSIYIHEYR